jgi:hypothetical protein
MYTREIQAPRSSPIENGVPLPGTWTRAFPDVDLLAIRRPFRVPLPYWIRHWRIKEWESFLIQDERYYLHAGLVDSKYCLIAQVLVYDREAKEPLIRRTVFSFNRRQMPRSLRNASIESHAQGFFFRIHNWLDTNTIRVDLHSKAERKRPSFTAHITFNFAKHAFTPMAVNLLFSECRCMYTYKAPAAVRLTMVLGGREISLHPKKALGLFCDGKGFLPYRMRGAWCTGLGMGERSAAGGGMGETNRRVGFSMGESQTREAYKNNENALWVDGALTPLPPVRITMPKGVESGWVIQDVEGMVDLAFTPQEQFRDAVNSILAKTEYTTLIGVYNGMLVTAQGEKILLKNFWGFGEKLYLRV